MTFIKRELAPVTFRFGFVESSLPSLQEAFREWFRTIDAKHGLKSEFQPIAIMKASWFFIGALLVSAGDLMEAVAIRHDVPDSEYGVSAAKFPALAYLPDEGHGVLIAKDWVVTAAHTTGWRPIHELTINGVSRSVAKVIVHPGYKPAPEELKSGDAAPLMAFAANSDDIALIKLDQLVTDVTPARIYRGSKEKGQTVEIIGAGATGNGRVGQNTQSPHRGELRRAEARVISADERWLGLRFEAPPNALPLEGMPADGDSGAPVLIKVRGRRELAGLVSRKFASGELSKFRCCLYGQMTYQVRVSRYADWIDTIVSNRRAQSETH